jgi:hypothetical protein
LIPSESTQPLAAEVISVTIGAKAARGGRFNGIIRGKKGIADSGNTGQKKCLTKPGYRLKLSLKVFLCGG